MLTGNFTLYANTTLGMLVGRAGAFENAYGGGGGSDVTALTQAVTNTGDGYATITYVGPATAVTPEPSSLLLLGTGVLSVAGVIKRRLH